MPRELILHGRVQGVACRYYCGQYGRRMGLRGAATNLYDGTVRVLLDTDDDNAIRDYMRALRTNPHNIHFYGHISDIDVYEHTGPISGDYVF